ncbi:MAG: DEAD/DEAH box helicase, partial [Pseudomonadota bacterium]
DPKDRGERRERPARAPEGEGSEPRVRARGGEGRQEGRNEGRIESRNADHRNAEHRNAEHRGGEAREDGGRGRRDRSANEPADMSHLPAFLLRPVRVKAG